MNFLIFLQLPPRNYAFCKQFLEHQAEDAVAHILVKFWPPGRFSLYCIAAVMISATVLPRRSRLWPDKDPAVTELWAAQTKNKIKSLSQSLQAIYQMRNVKGEGGEKNNKKYWLASQTGVWHIRSLIIAIVFIGIRAKESYKHRFKGR